VAAVMPLAAVVPRPALRAMLPPRSMVYAVGVAARGGATQATMVACVTAAGSEAAGAGAQPGVSRSALRLAESGVRT
jgi:hypothetical protein